MSPAVYLSYVLCLFGSTIVQGCHLSGLHHHSTRSRGPTSTLAPCADRSSQRPPHYSCHLLTLISLKAAFAGGPSGTVWPHNCKRDAPSVGGCASATFLCIHGWLFDVLLPRCALLSRPPPSPGQGLTGADPSTRAQTAAPESLDRLAGTPLLSLCAKMWGRVGGQPRPR